MIISDASSVVLESLTLPQIFLQSDVLVSYVIVLMLSPSRQDFHSRIAKCGASIIGQRYHL